MATYSTVVGVNNGVVADGASGARVRRVLITPLGQTVSSPQVPNPVIDKVLLKAVSKTGKKKDKIFVLRRIETGKVTSCDDLKKLIKKQLRNDVIDWEDFDVGYVSSKRGEKIISIRSLEDLAEVWKEIRAQGDAIQLWCDGLKVEGQLRKKRKKKHSDDDDDSEDDQPKKKSAKEEREDKLKQAMDTLTKKHGSNYTQMQYRIWSEVYANGMHTDLDSPPTNSMFKRAGSGTGTPSTKKKQTDSTSPEMAEALTQAASEVSSAIVAAFTPKSAVPSTSTCVSPAKVIENRSRCYKQLSDLQSLRSQGLLSEEEYVREKDAIMGLLKKLV